MSKRRREAVLLDCDENWSEGAESNPPTDSEYEDASKGAKSKITRRKNGKGKSPVKKKRVKLAEVDASGAHTSEPVAGLSAEVSPHSKSTHTVLSPGPVRSALLDWYKTVHDTRGMPWRKPYDPSLGPHERAQRAYEVWISEIMLQQTQVVTVKPYYNRWMEKFPTICDLAAATIDDVNALWKGLGYYSRASRLLAGAQKAVAEYGGRLPDNAKDMEANIPGIGRYSAGAICSIAYGEQVPVLDGNVHRLLSRFLALHAPPKAKATLDILWAGAEAMVDIDGARSNPAANGIDPESHPPQYPGDVNQALIELGSTVCKVREPSCESCPLKPWCAAYQENATPRHPEESAPIVEIEDLCLICEPVANYEGVTSYPMKADRKKSREELDIVHVVEWRPRPGPEEVNRKFLMVRRPDIGLLAGLYDFPSSPDVCKNIILGDQEKLAPKTLSRILSTPVLPSADISSSGNNCSRSESITISGIRHGGEVLHVFSHIRKTYRVQWVLLQGGDSPPSIRECPPPQKVRRKQKIRTGEDAVKVADRAATQNGAIWVPLEDVMDTNMGSGVVKVWNLAKALWET